MRNLDKILGTLYGQAIGDAMGMPAELWSREQIKATFKTPITTFLDGPQDNEIARYFTKGQYTDDTSQAFAILSALIATNWHPQRQVLVEYIMAWAESVDAWEQNILGPSSKAALTLIRQGQDPTAITKHALTNGAGMRIAPIGALFTPAQLNELVAMVVEITKITHASDVAFSGACMIAGAVSAGMADYSWDEIMTHALAANDLGLALGAPTWAAKNRRRLEVALELARKYQDQPGRFSQEIYETLGTGTMISESIPAAVAIAYYTRDVVKCAQMCANLGGDTDTIGAMATAICGAKTGLSNIPSTWQKLIDTQNTTYDLKAIGQAMLMFNAN